jgi:GTPase KRas protein
MEEFHARITQDREEYVPVLLVGNHCDKVLERQVSREEGVALAKRLQCAYLETSVPLAVNVERAFYTTVRMIVEGKSKGRYTNPYPQRRQCALM